MPPDRQPVSSAAEDIIAKLRPGRFQGYLRALVLVGVVGALLFSNLTGAQADPPEDPAAEPAVLSVDQDVDIAAATLTFFPFLPNLPTITCRITVTTPTAGALFVWADGEVRCNHPVGTIVLDVELTLAGGVVAHSDGGRDKTAGVSVMAEGDCSKGHWQAHAWSNIYGGLGYQQPSNSLIEKTSRTVSLDIDSDCEEPPPPPPPGPQPPCPPQVPKCRDQ
jgi:hypothetical protein